MQSQQQGQQAGQQQQGIAPRVPLCSEGKVLKGKWRIVRQIGMGAFGEIYIGRNVETNEKVAIKVEVVDEKKQALRAEVVIMKKLQGCPCVAQFVACGRQDNINFLVMQLLGENLSDLRKRQPGGTFSLPTVCRLAVEMIQALQSIHVLGILHRDVKPSNFVLDKSINSPDYTKSKKKKKTEHSYKITYYYYYYFILIYICSFIYILFYYHRKRRACLLVHNRLWIVEEVCGSGRGDQAAAA